MKNIPKPKPIANAENGGPPLEKSKTQRKNERRRQREKQKKAEEKQANALRAMTRFDGVRRSRPLFGYVTTTN